jgi:ADP-ribose pyrophosphatase YjhB (NUDIX family)
MKDMHPIQLQILRKLLFSEGIRFSDLKPDTEMENNQFDFHLDQLITNNYIKKTDSIYTLTTVGKEFANRMDTANLSIKPQAKISVLLCCRRKQKGKIQYLIYTRLKHPFYGCQGFFSGKVAYGEFVMEAAKRELKEESNLEGTPRAIGVVHYRVFDKNSRDIIEDKFMYACLVEDPKGELIGDQEGKYEWVNEDEVLTYIKKPFESFEELYTQVKSASTSSTFFFEERDEYTERF